jgi:arsenate reductase
LAEKGTAFETVNYLEHPLSAAELKKLLKQAGLRAHDAIRTKEDEYKQYVAGKDLSDDDLIAIMAAHPALIQRPIVVKGSKAVLARESDKLKDLGI